MKEQEEAEKAKKLKQKEIEDKRLSEKRKNEEIERRLAYLSNKFSSAAFRWEVRKDEKTIRTQGTMVLDYGKSEMQTSDNKVYLFTDLLAARKSKSKDQILKLAVKFTNDPVFKLKFEEEQSCNVCFNLLAEIRSIIADGVPDEKDSNGDALASPSALRVAGVPVMSPSQVSRYSIARHSASSAREVSVARNVSVTRNTASGSVGRRGTREAGQKHMEFGVTFESPDRPESPDSNPNVSAKGLRSPAQFKQTPESSLNSGRSRQASISPKRKIKHHHNPTAAWLDQSPLQPRERVTILHSNEWNVLKGKEKTKRIVHVDSEKRRMLFFEAGRQIKDTLNIQEIETFEPFGANVKLGFITGQAPIDLEFDNDENCAAFLALIKRTVRAIQEELNRKKEIYQWRVLKLNKLARAEDRVIIFEASRGILRNTTLEGEQKKQFLVREIAEIKTTEWNSHGSPIKVRMSFRNGNRPYDLKFQSGGECENFVDKVEQHMKRRNDKKTPGVNGAEKLWKIIKTNKFYKRQDRYLRLDYDKRMLQNLDMNLKVRKEFFIEHIDEVVPIAGDGDNLARVFFKNGKNPYNLRFVLPGDCESFVHAMTQLLGPQLCTSCGRKRRDDEEFCEACGDGYTEEARREVATFRKLKQEAEMRRLQAQKQLEEAQTHPIPADNQASDAAPGEPDGPAPLMLSQQLAQTQFTQSNANKNDSKYYHPEPTEADVKLDHFLSKLRNERAQNLEKLRKSRRMTRLQEEYDDDEEEDEEEYTF
mmetsp:Transcript_8148/g.15805  ORF Transcript_8148/g.15805 Transcript_8148/m.15805 type:complete len:762 (+) Transcript_8148:362-2647(+)